MDQSISRKTYNIKKVGEAHKVTRILKELVRHYDKRSKKLIYFLYEKGVSQKEIAERLGVTAQAIALQYPKGRP